MTIVSELFRKTRLFLSGHGAPLSRAMMGRKHPVFLHLTLNLFKLKRDMRPLPTPHFFEFKKADLDGGDSDGVDELCVEYKDVNATSNSCKSMPVIHTNRLFRRNH